MKTSLDRFGGAPNRRRLLGLSAALLLAAGIGGAIAVSASAAGVPDAMALTYTGYLETPTGVPVTGAVNIIVNVFDAAVDGNKVCEKTVMDLTLTSGRFQVELPDTCTAAVKANPNLWVEVLVGGASLGRSKLGAVPYALEAGHATSADSATNATNAARATAVLKTSFRDISGAACVFGGSATDCTCDADEVAISGGSCLGTGCGQPGVAQVESKGVASALNSWRLACENSAGTRVACAFASARCLRVAP